MQLQLEIMDEDDWDTVTLPGSTSPGHDTPRAPQGPFQTNPLTITKQQNQEFDDDKWTNKIKDDQNTLTPAQLGMKLLRRKPCSSGEKGLGRESSRSKVKDDYPCFLFHLLLLR